MADYYCLGSVLIDLPDEQLAEIAAILDEANNDENEEGNSPTLGNTYMFGQSYTWEKTHNSQLEEKRTLLVSSDDGEWFNAGLLGDAIHHVLAKHKSDNIVCFQWSYSCSKPRLDAYGGGAMVVSRRGWTRRWR